MLRLGASAKLARLDRLDRLRSTFGSAPVTPEAWLQAGEFWATVRRAGRTTADPHALDGDALLAAVAVTLGDSGDFATIATTNVEHLARSPGVDTRRWETIT